MEQLLAEAARQLGIHPETLRRQIKRGERSARRDQHGRYWVDLNGASAPHEAAEPSTHGVGDAYTPSRPEFERLLGEVEFLRAALEREQAAHGETRRLMGNLQAQMLALPAAPMPATAPERAENAPENVEPVVRASGHWWRFWKH